MSKHLSTEKLSACFWAVIVVTSGCGLILLALNSPTPTDQHHQQAKAPILETTPQQAVVVETRAAPDSERND